MNGRQSRPVRIVGKARFAVADDKPTFWDRVAAGTWEPETLAALARLVGPGSTLLDIGAWVGPISLYAAALGAAVVAVEADPAALVQLRANLAVNPELSSRIRVLEKAAAPRPGTVRFGARRKPGDSMSSALLARDAEGWTAPAITPADLADLVPDTDRLVVKIDIEGGEYALLPALAPLLARRPSVLLSLHPRLLEESGCEDVECATRVAFAPFAGWHAYALDEAGPIPCEIEALVAGRGTEWLLLPPGTAPFSPDPSGPRPGGPAP